MKPTIISIIILVGLGLVLAKADGKPPVPAIMAAMWSGTYAEEYDVYAFPKIGTNDIPELLTRVGNTNILTSFPVNQLSSLRRFACSEGMIALWLIEGIRIGGRFPSLVPVCYDKSKTVPDGALFYAEADQDAVARAYLSWWKTVNGQPKDITQIAAPLDGTPLTWFGGRITEEKKR